VLATVRDAKLSWDGTEVTLDLCSTHKREVDAGKWTLPDLLKLGDQPPPARRPPGRKPGSHGGGRPQPTGDEAEAIRIWCRDGQIKTRDDQGPQDRLAYQARTGQGQYFPAWLLVEWEAMDPARRAELMRLGGEAVAARKAAGSRGYRGEDTPVEPPA
jgi:hypothetical protein